MEALVARIGDQVAGGGSLIAGSTNVFANFQPVSFLDSPITPHGCCGAPLPGCFIHCFSKIVVGSKTVFVNNTPAVRLGDIASCGDPIITSATNVLFG